MFAYGVKAFTVGPAASAACLLFLLYGPAIAAFTYLISFMFVSHSTAQIVVMFFNFITGLCLSVVSFVLTTIPSTASISLSLRYLFRIFPSYCLGDGLTQLAMCEEGKDCPVIGSSGYDFSRTQGPFAWDIAGGDLLFLGIQAIVYFLLALLIEYALTFPTLASWLYSVEDPGYRPTDDEDEDVEAERQRILRTGNTTDVVHIRELRKVYPANSNSGGFSFGNIVRNLVSLCVGKRKTTASKDGKVKIKVAVQSLCFGVPKGECFGFLGNA